MKKSFLKRAIASAVAVPLALTQCIMPVLAVEVPTDIAVAADTAVATHLTADSFTNIDPDKTESNWNEVFAGILLTQPDFSRNINPSVLANFIVSNAGTYKDFVANLCTKLDNTTVSYAFGNGFVVKGHLDDAGSIVANSIQSRIDNAIAGTVEQYGDYVDFSSIQNIDFSSLHISADVEIAIDTTVIDPTKSASVTYKITAEDGKTYTFGGSDTVVNYANEKFQQIKNIVTYSVANISDETARNEIAVSLNNMFAGYQNKIDKAIDIYSTASDKTGNIHASGSNLEDALSKYKAEYTAKLKAQYPNAYDRVEQYVEKIPTSATEAVNKNAVNQLYNDVLASIADMIPDSVSIDVNLNDLAAIFDNLYNVTVDSNSNGIDLVGYMDDDQIAEVEAYYATQGKKVVSSIKKVEATIPNANGKNLYYNVTRILELEDIESTSTTTVTTTTTAETTTTTVTSGTDDVSDTTTSTTATGSGTETGTVTTTATGSGTETGTVTTTATGSGTETGTVTTTATGSGTETGTVTTTATGSGTETGTVTTTGTGTGTETGTVTTTGTGTGTETGTVTTTGTGTGTETGTVTTTGTGTGTETGTVTTTGTGTGTETGTVTTTGTGTGTETGTVTTTGTGTGTETGTVTTTGTGTGTETGTETTATTGSDEGSDTTTSTTVTTVTTGTGEGSDTTTSTTTGTDIAIVTYKVVINQGASQSEGSFYYSHDNESFFDKNEFSVVAVYETGDEKALDADAYTLNYNSPYEAFAAKANKADWTLDDFKFEIVATINDEAVSTASAFVYIGKEGDADLNNAVNSSDSSNILAYYAAHSSGKPETPLYSADDKLYEEFALFLTETNADDAINSSDSSNVLDFYAKSSSGKMTSNDDVKSFWDAKLPESIG